MPGTTKNIIRKLKHTCTPSNPRECIFQSIQFTLELISSITGGQAARVTTSQVKYATPIDPKEVAKAILLAGASFTFFAVAHRVGARQASSIISTSEDEKPKSRQCVEFSTVFILKAASFLLSGASGYFMETASHASEHPEDASGHASFNYTMAALLTLLSIVTLLAGNRYQSKFKNRTYYRPLNEEVSDSTGNDIVLEIPLKDKVGHRSSGGNNRLSIFSTSEPSSSLAKTGVNQTGTNTVVKKVEITSTK